MTLALSAGQVLTADLINAFVPVYAQKTGNQAVSASTVLVDDTEIQLALVAGRTYRVDLFMAAGGTAAGDVVVAWRNTGTMTFPTLRHTTGPTIGTTSVTGTVAAATTVGVNVAAVRSMGSVSYGVDGTNTSSIQESFVAACTVSGLLIMQFAQVVASGAITVTTNTFATATPIN